MTAGWHVPQAEPDAAPELVRCRICDHWGPDSRDQDGVQTGPVRWFDPLPGKVFDAVPRCLDHEACWRRVTDAGDPWPVNDGRPRGIRRPVPAVAEEPVVEPAAEYSSDHSSADPLEHDDLAEAAQPLLEDLKSSDQAGELDWGFGA